MKKLILFIIVLSANLYSQEPALDSIALAEVTVSSKVIDVAIERKTPVAFTTVSGQEIAIKGGNLDLPEVLKRVPGIYIDQDNGGYGDSNINLRGFGRTNTTIMINGQPVNDMENGVVYWSNWMGVIDIASSIQIQRGLSAKSLAVPSVGGVISINTRSAEAKPGSGVRMLYGNDNYQKITAYTNTGVNENGWSSSWLMGFWQGDGWRNGTKGEGMTYAFSVGYTPRGGNHEFNFSGLGAAQWHHQGWFYTELQDFIKYGPVQGDDFRKFNLQYGEYKGEEFSFARNYYNKPLFTANWDWQIAPNVQLATSLYMSAGRGGGTGDQGRNGSLLRWGRNFDSYENGSDFRRNDMTIDFDAVVAQNIAGAYVPEDGPFAGMKIGVRNSFDGGPNVYDAMTTVRHASDNSHNWFGGISKIKIDSDNFRYELGVDLRSYAGIHRRVVSDFLGLDGFASTIDRYAHNPENPSGRVPVILTESYESSPWERIGRENNPLGRYYVGYVKWAGVNGLIEYTGSERFSAVLQAGTSSQKYWLENYASAPPSNSSRKVTVDGGYIKGGANFNIDDKSNVFVNLGQIKKPPLVEGVFVNENTDYTEAETITTEKITSFEIGYGFISKNFIGKANFYSTKWGDRNFTDFERNDAGDQIIITYEDVEQVHSGLEVEFQWYPTYWLKIKGMGSFGDWKFNKNFNGTAFNQDTNQSTTTSRTLYLDGAKIGNAAQTTMYLGADFKINRDLSFDIDFQTFDDLYAGFSADSSYFEDPSNQGSFELPSYSLVDLGLSFQTRLFGYDARIRANVNNLFDEEYISVSRSNRHPEAGGDLWRGVNTRNSVYFGRGTSWNLGLNLIF